MSYFLAIMFLAAGKRGLKGWGNILFIVIIAIFYVVGSIAKARANKAQQRDGEQLSRKPQRKPSKVRGGLQRQFFEVGAERPREHGAQVQPQRRKMVRPQPAARKLSAEKEQVMELPTMELALRLEEPKELVGKPLKKLESEDVAIAAEIAQAKYLAEILSDYGDPDELRTAILHYEILGRPLSLRGPSERVIGL